MAGARIRRSVVGCLVGALALAGLAGGVVAPAGADAPFTMSLVGGSFSLGNQGTIPLNPGIACQNGTDDEFLAPFGTPDGLVDYPDDPQCTSPYDANETLAGFQAPDPVEFTGTIDPGFNISVNSNFAPVDLVFSRPSPTLGVCDDDLLVTKASTSFTDLAPHTGSLGAGTLTLNLRLDTVLDIRCDADLGPGVNFVPFDFDGPGGMDPWGGPTPVACAHSVSSLNPSASGDSAPASVHKTQDPAVTNPMTGKDLKPAWMFGDVFDAVPITTPDTRCGFFNLLVFGTAGVDNSAVQFAFILGGSDYVSQPGIDVNVGDVTVPEGDGGLGVVGCGLRDCTNIAQVVVSLESPCPVALCQVGVIADNTTGGSANGTLTGRDILPPGPADYKAFPATKPKLLNFKLGKSTAKLTIPITPDQNAEAPETIFVQVVSVTAGLTINDGVGMVTIVDDDGGTEPDGGISIGDAIVYETGESALCGGPFRCKGTAVLPIVAQSPVASLTTLTYTISNGENVLGVFTAAEAVNGKTFGDDFLPTLTVKTKVLKAGKNFLPLVITVYGDNTDEGGTFSGETFTVSIDGPGVTDGIGTVRINNDDT